MQPLRRRELLKRLSVLSLGGTIPTFLKTAHAASTNSETILVVIQLSGGNDGLNTVVPYADDAYHANRTKLRLRSNQLITLDDTTAFHASMRGMVDLFESERLAVVQGVGYPAPSRSHEESMAVWHTASTDQEDHNGYGWLGRAFDHSSRSNPTSIFVSNQELPTALRGRRATPAAIDSISDFSSAVPPQQPSLRSADSSRIAEFMRQATVEAYETAKQVESVTSRSESGRLGQLNSGLSKRLKTIADLIRSDFGPRVYYCTQSGYDTHAEQFQTHATLLSALSQSLKAFLDDLEAAGLSDRVTVLCFSEFGRQVQENASRGTDHGTAGPVFLAGAPVQGGLFGQAPDLTALHRNAPAHTVDFRSIYASVLHDWLGISDSGGMLPKTGREFANLRLFI